MTERSVDSPSKNGNNKNQVALELPVDALSRRDSDFSDAQLLHHYQLQMVQDIASDGDQTTLSYARQGFRIGELCLMIAYEDGSELVDIPNIYYIPNVPDWFLGVVNLHGVVIPVVSVANYLDISSHTSEHKQRLLILGHGNEAVGIVIDNLPDRLHWTSQQRISKNTAPAKLLEHVRHACLIDNELWFDLDSASFCQALEDTLQR